MVSCSPPLVTTRSPSSPPPPRPLHRPPPRPLPRPPPPPPPRTSPELQTQTQTRTHIRKQNQTRDKAQSLWVQTLRSQARDDDFTSALETFISMCNAGVSPDHFALPAALRAASGLRRLSMGKQLHASSVKFGYQESSIPVLNTLITMYSRCGELGSALRLFDKMPVRDQVSWNSLITALCLYEEWVSVLTALRAMLTECEISSFTLVSIFVACSNLPGLKLGKSAHAYGLRNGLFTNGKAVVYNALITMYAKFGELEKSILVFSQFENRNLVSWNSMISSLVQNHQFTLAIRTFYKLVQSTDLKPDGVSLASVLPAISKLDLLNIGREIHAYILKNDDLLENPFVAGALVNVYCNLGRVETGRFVFDQVKVQRHGLWNAMISGYTQNGLDEGAIKLFIEMESLTGLKPNQTTIASVLPACIKGDLFERKESIHGYVIKRKMEKNKFVQNALMDMYARLGNMEVSRRIFYSMEIKDVVSWNTLMAGHAIDGAVSEAFDIMAKMQSEYNGGMKPNTITLITVLPLCGSHALISKGKEIHCFAIRHYLDADVAVGSALADMYAKCGFLKKCQNVFDKMPNRNVVTWNVLITAHGMHGLGEKAINAFNEMVLTKEAKPNDITFISLLAACSHSGMVRRGLSLFKEMKSMYNVDPTPDHYACMVDILGRAGKLKEAHDLIRTLINGPHTNRHDMIGAWSSLLGACRLHKNVKLGSIVARHLIELEPDEASHYVLLSNIYSASGEWENAIEVRTAMKLNNVKKEPGCSWIESGSQIHKFLAGESSHPDSSRIHSFWGDLWEKMKKKGYRPDLSCVVYDVDEREKDRILRVHSEKLAIAFGLLSLPKGAPIRVTKNLRVCNDCHETAKFVSKMEKRVIVLRDVKRFHHFRNGVCSCGDYW